MPAINRLFILILFWNSSTFIRVTSAQITKINKATLNSVSPSVDQTIDDIITPSDTCKYIVSRFGSAVSNFTLCSVRNARPIHLCQWCVQRYLKVVETYEKYTATTDEKGNPCRDYFTNLDRIEIVTDAYKYVEDLWSKGKCDNCFEHEKNGTLVPRATEDTIYFQFLYFETKICFNNHLNTNDTCYECKSNYSKLNDFYIHISNTAGENLCVDIIDTMNTTREIWSNLYGCRVERQNEYWPLIALGSMALIPVLFYLFAALLSSKKEARILTQRRMAEVFASSSNSREASSSNSTRPRSSIFRRRFSSNASNKSLLTEDSTVAPPDPVNSQILDGTED